MQTLPDCFLAGLISLQRKMSLQNRSQQLLVIKAMCGPPKKTSNSFVTLVIVQTLEQVRIAWESNLNGRGRTARIALLRGTTLRQISKSVLRAKDKLRRAEVCCGVCDIKYAGMRMGDFNFVFSPILFIFAD